MRVSTVCARHECPADPARRFRAEDNEWDAHFYRRLPGGQPPYAKPKHLHSSPSLNQLLPRIDAHILSTPALNPEIDLRRTAGWRFTPASEGQASIILKKLAKPLAEEGFEQRSWIDAVWVGGRKGERKEVGELRKGEASDLISRVKHGGMASVRKVEGQVRKEERRVEKVQGKRVQEKEKKEKKIVAASGRKAAGGENRFAKHMKAMSLARKMAKLSEGRSWKPEGV